MYFEQLAKLNRLLIFLRDLYQMKCSAHTDSIEMPSNLHLSKHPHISAEIHYSTHTSQWGIGYMEGCQAARPWSCHTAVLANLVLQQLHHLLHTLLNCPLPCLKNKVRVLGRLVGTVDTGEPWGWGAGGNWHY